MSLGKTVAFVNLGLGESQLYLIWRNGGREGADDENGGGRMAGAMIE